jgi:hypothetical protein
MTEYVSAAETARLARQALRREFPGVKFAVQVHRYDDGASLSVRWTGGPGREAVDKVVQQYAGAEFDQMTEGRKPRVVQRDVQFGTDYVFTERYDPPAAGGTITGVSSAGNRVVIAQYSHHNIGDE